jgi:hypothetical protein
MVERGRRTLTFHFDPFYRVNVLDVGGGRSRVSVGGIDVQTLTTAPFLLSVVPVEKHAISALFG